MSYETLFQRYGSPSTEAEIRITAYLIRPDKLTADRIPWNDEKAARLISDCESLIASLKEYRQALAERYAMLQTAPYKLRLEIERKPSYNGSGVLYYVRIIREYQDGTEVQELAETYQGKQRREALARFEELKKQRPGIEIVKDIERRSWER